MKLTGNTILITGGGSSIGLGLAAAFQAAGNTVIIAGRRQEMLNKAEAAYPGMKSCILDVNSPEAIRRLTQTIISDYPNLNIVINNAGIMRTEDLTDPLHLIDSEAIVTTNLLGPIRLISAFLPHLLKQESAVIITVSSGLAFVPLAMTPTYCATKAALHSYTESL
jgi:uncharacterized oxidoreductase